MPLLTPGPIPEPEPDPTVQPRIGVTFSTNGNSEGQDYATLEEAAGAIHDWVLGIKPYLADRSAWSIDVEAVYSG